MSSLSFIGKQWRPDQHHVALALAPSRVGVRANDDMPFHFAWLPQRHLRVRVRMLIEARIPDTQEVSHVWLPFDGIPREGSLSVLQRQGLLENSDQGLLARQSLFAIEQEMAKLGIAGPGQCAGFTDRREGTIHQVRLCLHAFDPPQNGGRTVTAIFSLFVGHVFLKIVIAVPLLMCRQQVFPGVCFFEAPVSHPPLNVNYVELDYSIKISGMCYLLDHFHPL
jgi:hypothetical protein